MQGDKLLMSAKERQRQVLLEEVRKGYRTLKEVALQLKISYRQAKRLRRRYRELGAEGLLHGNRGKASNCAFTTNFKEAVLSRYKTLYAGFGPTLACEKLAQNGYELSDETLRFWLKKAGLWQAQRRRSAYRKHRARRECFGELLQLDGSHHAWFGADQPKCCLMNLVDDATGVTLALLAEEETTEAALNVLRQWIERYGVPHAIYVDLKTVYVSGKTNGEGEWIPGFTHFSAACRKLGIQIIKAYSPQAKGRVERKHAVFQDRFVKELALQGIKTLGKANKLLDNSFLEEINRKFAKAPQSPENAHGNPTSYGDLEQIFCWEYQRNVQNDFTISFEAQRYQLQKTTSKHFKPKQKITVRRHLDKTLSLWLNDQKLDCQRIEKVLKRDLPVKPKRGHDPLLMSQRARQNKSNTPWNRFTPGWLKTKKQKLNRSTHST